MKPNRRKIVAVIIYVVGVFGLFMVSAGLYMACDGYDPNMIMWQGVSRPECFLQLQGNPWYMQIIEPALWFGLPLLAVWLFLRSVKPVGSKKF